VESCSSILLLLLISGKITMDDVLNPLAPSKHGLTSTTGAAGEIVAGRRDGSADNDGQDGAGHECRGCVRLAAERSAAT
jgi:hypothetical protein